MPLNSVSADVSCVSLGHLQLAHPTANVRLHAECQVLRRTGRDANKNSHGKLSLLAGLGCTGLETTAQDLGDAIESSLNYADLWQQLPLKPVLSDKSAARGLPCSSVTLHNTDQCLLPRYGSTRPAISGIHLALLYTRSGHQSQNNDQAPSDEENDMLEPGSPNTRAGSLSVSCIAAAMSLFDLALRTFIYGKRARSGTKGLVLESIRLERSLADLDPFSFSPGYSTSLVDRAGYISHITQTLCDIQRRTQSIALKNAFDHVSEVRTGTLKHALERKLFHLAADTLYDSSAAGRLKPITLRYAPGGSQQEVAKPVEPVEAVEAMKAAIPIEEEFKSLFEVESVAEVEFGIEGDAGIDGEYFGDESRPFESLFDEVKTEMEAIYDKEREGIYALLLEENEDMHEDEHEDEDDVLLDDAWYEDIVEWERADNVGGDGDACMCPLDCGLLL